MHLETAEREKKEIHKELKACKKRLARLEHTDAESVRSVMTTESHWTKEREELERKLEQLGKDRELSGGVSPQKVQEELVELKSRYQVTQNMLESATVENHALVDALKQKEHLEQKMKGEIDDLKAKLRKSDLELENAKYIATSALIKVEELTMESVKNRPVDKNGKPISPIRLTVGGQSSQEDDEVHYLRKKVEALEKEIETAKELNGSLEGSIQERDRILHALADHHSQPMSSFEKEIYLSPQKKNSSSFEKEGYFSPQQKGSSSFGFFSPQQKGSSRR
jgi:chromosome segregation ATPase